MDGRRTFLHPARGAPAVTRKAARAPGWKWGSPGLAPGGSPPETAGRSRAGHAAEKSRRRVEARRTVPQTDTGGWVEQTKVRGRDHVKELGKTAP